MSFGQLTAFFVFDVVTFLEWRFHCEERGGRRGPSQAFSTHKRRIEVPNPDTTSRMVMRSATPQASRHGDILLCRVAPTASSWRAFLFR